MTHIEAELPGAFIKALAEWAASRGERLVVERDGRSTYYRFIPIGAR